jgi:hypothetical protein
MSIVISVPKPRGEREDLDYPVDEKLGQGKKHELRFTEMLSFLRVIFAEQKSAKEYVELTEDELLYAYRFNDEGDYEQLLPNGHERFELQELNGEIAV